MDKVPQLAIEARLVFHCKGDDTPVVLLNQFRRRSNMQWLGPRRSARALRRRCARPYGERYRAMKATSSGPLRVERGHGRGRSAIT